MRRIDRQLEQSNGRPLDCRAVVAVGPHVDDVGSAVGFSEGLLFVWSRSGMAVVRTSFFA